MVPRKGRVSGKKGAPALNVVRSTFDFPEDLHRKLKLRAVMDERLPLDPFWGVRSKELREDCA